MTSPCRKNDTRLKYCAEDLSFVTNVTVRRSKEKNLHVPKSFTGKYQKKLGKELPKVVHFKLPCGAEWEVEVTEKNGHFWFEKGWEDFSKFYRLQSHDVLYFKYKGASIFKVKIYESKSQIDYPIKSQIMQENDVNDHSPPATTLLPQKTKEATSGCGKKDISAKKNEGMNLKSSTAQRPPKPTTDDSMQMHSSATGGKARALQRADEKFKSKDPSCFLVKMQRTYIKQNCIWLSTENSKIIMEYLGKNPGTVNLCVPEDSEEGPWTVEMKYDTERATFRILNGWRKFAERHKLNFGDVCGFMLNDKSRLLFEVKIFRRTELATSSPGIDEDDVDVKDYGDANDDDAADINTDRFFRKVLQKSSMSQCLYLCSRFSRRYLSNEPSTAELHVPAVKDKHWSVGLKYDVGRKRAKFQTHWANFVKDNDFKLGNRLVFELTDENEISFKVVRVAENSTLPPDDDAANENINDDENSKDEDEEEDHDVNSDNDCHDEDEDEYTSAQQHHKRKRSSSSTKSSIKDVGTSDSTGQFLKRRAGVQKDIHPIRAAGNDTALQRAKDFKYVGPHFVVQMSLRDVHGPILLPSTFVMEYLDQRPSHVSLWGIDKDIKYWPVELQHFSNAASFQVGWIEFVQFHGLKDGDACGFELTDKRKFLFDVHIFRAA